jgi:hypothetical protein
MPAARYTVSRGAESRCLMLCRALRRIAKPPTSKTSGPAIDAGSISGALVSVSVGQLSDP